MRVLGFLVLGGVILSSGCSSKVPPAPDPNLSVSLERTPLTAEPRRAVEPQPETRRWRETQKVMAQNGARNEWFGSSISMAGDEAVIGAERSHVTAPYAGAAFVFGRGSGGWEQRLRLLASDGKESDYFGTFVALAGDTVLVGAPHRAGRYERAGAVYAFTKRDRTWAEQQIITPADAKLDDAFGGALALIGDVAFFGSASNDTAGPNSGAVYVFERRADAWAEVQKLVGRDTVERDGFGYAIAASDDTLLVGAVSHRVEGDEAGAAYVFVREGERWVQQAKLTSMDRFSTSGFGRAVALAGDTAVVGAHASHESAPLSGSVHVFARREGVWKLQQKLLPSDGKKDDHFGASVAVSGDRIFVGSNSGELAQDAGALYVFERRLGAWTQRQKLMASDGKKFEFFTSALALDGDRALVGAFHHADMFGAAYALEWR